MWETYFLSLKKEKLHCKFALIELALLIIFTMLKD
jgi:hypothetical protein